MTEHVKPAQVALRLFFESLTLLSCYFSLSNTSSKCHSTVVCTVLILLLLLLCDFEVGESLQKLSLGETNQQQIPSFCVCAKNIERIEVEALSIYYKGI